MPTSSIPQSLAPFFLEYPFSDLIPERDATTIIECTLRVGTREEIYWLFKQYSRSQIADWLSRNGPERLPEPHLTFWKFLLELGNE
jgi:hypothetical protein